MAGKMQLPLETRFWMKVEKSDGCWNWTASKDKNGYGRLGRSRAEGPILASRASWEIHHGPIKDGLHVLHKCDNPSCVRPSHLFLGDAAMNCFDKKMKGRAAIKGRWLVNLTAAVRARRALTDEQALELVKLRHAGLTFIELGERFGIHKWTARKTLLRYEANDIARES